MKKTLPLILLLILSSLAYAQKELREALPFKNEVTIRRADGAYQIAKLTYKEKVGRADPVKLYFWYRRDSIRHTQGAYQGHLLNGPYRELYANKALKVLGAFYNGLPDGQWRYFDPNGTLRRTSNWVLGEENGKYRLYDEQGHLKEKGRLFNGLKEGTVISYHPQDGVKKAYTRYKHNVASEGKVNRFDRITTFLGF